MSDAPQGRPGDGTAPAPPAPLEARLRRAGAIVLALGLAAAAAIYALAAPDDDALAAAMDNKGYEFQLERIGGKAAVLAAEFNRWFEGLWQGRHLAYTVAILATAAALGCFFLAHLLETGPPPAGGNKD
jgi:hypothetical protein